MTKHRPYCPCFEAFYEWEGRYDDVDDDDEEKLDRLKSIPLIWKEIVPHNDSMKADDPVFNKALQIIEDARKSGSKKLSFRSLLSWDEYQQLTCLPETIGDLCDLEELDLYSSNLSSIPREIGKCKSLKNFVPYTSYRLHWFPYEITKCPALIDSTVSTRALYGNYKFRPPFPNLTRHRISVYDDIPRCSVCDKGGVLSELTQYWVTLPVATDVIPLLVSVCSDTCLSSIGHTPEGYIEGVHRGGRSVSQPPMETWLYDF